MKTKALLFFIGIMFSESLFAENVIYNGDFQLGASGFSIERWQRPDTNPELTFPPLTAEDDPHFPGQKMLRIDNLYKEHQIVYGRETELTANKTYYLRGEIRSSGPQFPVDFSIIYLKKSVGRNAQGGSVVASSEWKKFEIPISTKKFGGMYHLKLTMAQPKDAGTVWLRALSLSSLDDAEFHGLEMGLNASSRIYVREDGKPAKCTVMLHNASKDVYAKNVRILAVDDYSGEHRIIAKKMVRMKPNSVETFEIALPLDRFGSFRIEPDDAAIRFFPGYYAVLGKAEVKPFDKKRYCFGINNGIPLKWKKGTAPGYIASNASVREELRLLSLAGCRLVRIFTGLGNEWSILEPEPGKFDFRYMDSSLKILEEAGIAPFPVLCYDKFVYETFPWSLPQYPDWLVKGEPYATLGKSTRDWRGYDCPERLYVFPKRPVLENYISAIVTHAGKRVMQYEICNEPGCAISPEQYIEFALKPISAVIRKKNPAATIVSVCSTGDLGFKVGPFMQKCLDLNALNYSDAVSFHPYGSPELSSPDPADRQILSLKDLVSKYKPGTSIWNTELFYLFSGYKFGDFFGAMQVKAHHVAARYLVELSLGIAQSMPLERMQIWREMMIPHYQHITSWPDIYPGPIYSAYNALTRFFEGAEAVSHRNTLDGIYRCMFRKDGRLVAAVWDYRKRGAKLNLSDFEVFDLFGNPMKSGVIAMKDAPVYLKQGKLSDQEFEKKVNDLSAIHEQSVTVSSLTRLVVRGDSAVLIVGLCNYSDKQESGYIGISGKGISAAEPVPFTLKRKEKKSIEIPVKVTGNVTEGLLRLNTAGSTRGSTVGVIACKSADMNREYTFHSPDGAVSAICKVVHAGKKTIVTVKVNDKTDSGDSGIRGMWEQDCVEFFFDATPRVLPEENADSYQSSVFRLFVMPRLVKEKQLVFWGDKTFLSEKDFECEVKNGAEGYEVRLTLPEKTFGPELGMEIKIDDAEDSASATRWFSLFGTKAPQEKRLGFTIMKGEN